MCHLSPSLLKASLYEPTNCTWPKSFAPWVMIPVILVGTSMSTWKTKRQKEMERGKEKDNENKCQNPTVINKREWWELFTSVLKVHESFEMHLEIFIQKGISKTLLQLFAVYWTILLRHFRTERATQQPLSQRSSIWVKGELNPKVHSMSLYWNFCHVLIAFLLQTCWLVLYFHYYKVRGCVLCWYYSRTNTRAVAVVFNPLWELWNSSFKNSTNGYFTCIWT